MSEEQARRRMCNAGMNEREIEDAISDLADQHNDERRERESEPHQENDA